MVARRTTWFLFLVLLAIMMLSACADAAGELPSRMDDGELLYDDQFSPDEYGPWLLESDEYGSTAIQDGRLVIDVAQPDSMQYSTLEEPEFSDFDLRVETQLVEGGRDATYGLLFRMASPEQFYRFEVTGDGRYVVERRDPGSNWERLVQGWQRSPAIMSGPGAVNSWRVTANGPALAFYANDDLLAEVQDSAYIGGKIALDAGTFGAHRTIVAFDNLAVGAP